MNARFRTIPSGLLSFATLLTVGSGSVYSASSLNFTALGMQGIAMAMRAYAEDHGTWPTDICDPQGKPLLSWRVRILPYLEGRYLFEQFKLDEPWDSPHNMKLLKGIPKDR